MLDARIISDMQEISMPFPMTKLCDGGERGGTWYVWGTKALLIRELDEDDLQVTEYQGYGEEHFLNYMRAQTPAEYNRMKNLLQTDY